MHGALLKSAHFYKIHRNMQSLLDIYLIMQEPPSLFLLFDKEAVQRYVDPHMNPQQGKREPVLPKDRSTWKTFGITVLKQTCSAFPPPIDSGKKDVIKELK